MAWRDPELTLETVIVELCTPLVMGDETAELTYLVLEKHGEQISLDVESEDIGERLAVLMPDHWAPLGLIGFRPPHAKPFIRRLRWYDELLKTHGKRYKRLCAIVSARLNEAAKRLTLKLVEDGVIRLVQ